jgi:hypothetical protein
MQLLTYISVVALKPPFLLSDKYLVKIGFKDVKLCLFTSFRTDRWQMVFIDMQFFIEFRVNMQKTIVECIHLDEAH